MFEWISSPEAWIALTTLTVLEIVLGIDNIIFISICLLLWLAGPRQPPGEWPTQTTHIEQSRV